jgi:hypothetical protein
VTFFSGKSSDFIVEMSCCQKSPDKEGVCVFPVDEVDVVIMVARHENPS